MLPISPDPTLRHLVAHVDRTYREQMDERLAARGISQAGYMTMFVLRRVPALSNADLARWLGVTPQAMNQILHGLVEAKHVRRKPSATHGRILTTHLTAKGVRAVEECEADAAEIERRMCSGMDAGEQELLSGLLQKCAAGLGRPVPPAHDAVAGS